jgi:tripartite-type tricarboxylate transporter receptor subunit TctC
MFIHARQGGRGRVPARCPSIEGSSARGPGSQLHRLAFVVRPLLAACVLAAGGTASAQPYPHKPIRMIVPVTPGGSTDSTARIVSQRMGELLGQPIIIDNRPGAGSIIGTDLVAKSAPDGYTLLMAFATHITMPHLNRKLPFDPVADFQAVSLLATQPLIIIVNAQTPAKSVKELIALAKAQPGKLHFGLPSSGSAAHIAGEMFKLVTGTNLTAVPYKGASPAQQALAGNEVQMMFANLQTGISMLKLGRISVIGVAAPARLAQFPDVPTLAEQGIPQFEVEPWQGILGPARLPKAVVDVLHRAAVDAVRTPDVVEKLVATGSTPIGSTPRELADRIQSQLKSWGNVIRKAGIGG